MSTINIFQISFEIWGCIISILVCILLGAMTFEMEDSVGKKLWTMVLVNNFLLISDSLAYIYRGDLSLMGTVMTRVCNFSLFALEYAIFAIFVRYVKDLTGGQEEKSVTWWEIIVFIFMAMGYCGLVITQFTGLYYSFDSTNHYQRGNGLWMNFAVYGVILLICFLRLWQRRKKLNRGQAATFFSCVMIFAGCFVIQFFFYGLSLIHVGMTVSLLLLYIKHNKMQYEAYIDKSIEEAIRDTKALLEWEAVSDHMEEETPEVDDEENKK